MHRFVKTHLPVDAVLEADGVRRSTEDGQLQNETLHKKTQETLSLLIHWSNFFVASPAHMLRLHWLNVEDVTPTDNKTSQQGDAEGDSKRNGLNATLVRRVNFSTCHFREHVSHAETKRKTTKSAELQQMHTQGSVWVTF